MYILLKKVLMAKDLTKKASIINKLKINFFQSESNYIDAYHLKDIKSNLFFEPYEGIDERANSIRSSAAMIYNTIGPDSIIFDGIKYSQIEYEREFPALNKKDNSDHDHSAHLDVSMLSEDKKELALIEAKCTEWFYNPKSMKVSYLSPNCYLPETGFYTQHFIESFRSLKLCPEQKDPEDNTRLLPFYQKYDAVQMNIHILGIYNFCARKEEKLPKKIRLLNIVWDYNEAEEYQTEEREGKEYVSFANVNFRNLFKQIGVEFSVEYVRYSDFLKRVDWSNDMEHRKYLERYEIK